MFIFLAESANCDDLLREKGGGKFVDCLVYLIQFGLLAGEGEGETNWKFLVFDVVFFHEVTKTLCHMVKQLEWRWKEGEVISCGAQNKLFTCVYFSVNLLPFQCRE